MSVFVFMVGVLKLKGLLPFMSGILRLKGLLSDCKRVEADLWTLVSEYELHNLKDEHAQLRAIVTDVFKVANAIHAENDDVAKLHMKEFQKKLLALEELLFNQHKQLSVLEKFSHEEIVNILNADKRGKDISETSQAISDLETWLENTIDKNLLENTKGIDYAGITAGKDYSYMSLKEAKGHVWEGEPRKVLPKLLRAGKRPLSMADLMRTRVGVYKKLVDQGLGVDDIANDSLFRFWWDEWWTSGDALLYGDGRFRFQTGKNEVWDMKDAVVSAQVTQLRGADIRRYHGFWKKEEIMQDANWLVIAQGDAKLLAAYVEIVCSLKSGPKMSVNLSPETERGFRGCLWWLGALGYNLDCGASGSYGLNIRDGRFFGV